MPPQKPQSAPDFIPDTAPDFIPAPVEQVEPHPLDSFVAQPSFGEKVKAMVLHPLNSMAAASNPVSRPRNASMPEMLATDLHNVGAGATNVFRHPLDTLTGALASVGGVVTAPFEAAQGKPTEFNEVFNEANTNGPEFGANLIGSGLATAGLAKAAPLALRPVSEMIPTRAKAGKLFEETMGAAGDMPVNLETASDPLMRAYELGERGMTRPKVVNQLVRRVTAPESEPLTYREARDFAQSLSRQSSSEGQKLTPAMKAQIGKLSHSFNEDVGRTAQQAGVGEQYQKAMEGYRRAMQLRSALIKGAKYGAGTLAAGYAAHRLVPAILPER